MSWKARTDLTRQGHLDPKEAMVLITPENRDATVELLTRLVGIGADFKLGDGVAQRRLTPHQVRDLLVTELPKEGREAENVVRDLVRHVLPLCNNEASPRFLGFGHTGADVAALAGGLLALFAQQNLINQSFAAPSATFTEIAVLRWLRDLLGYPNPLVGDVASVWDVGGVTTYGGTGSNAVAMLLARENAVPGTLHEGVREPERMHIVVPAGIGHYSVKSALEWIGVGGRIIEVPTRGYHRRTLLQPTQGLHRDQMREDRHLLRSSGHTRIIPALGKIL